MNFGGRIPKDDQRLRIGDPNSPFAPGDPSPGGGVYRAGQFSPNLDDLAAETFSSAKDAGVLPSGLPIYDSDGEVDIKKLDNWDPNAQGVSAVFDDSLPKYSSAVVASALLFINPNLLKALNISVTKSPKMPGEFGNYIIAAKTNGGNRQFSSQIIVFPEFYKFIDKPVVQKSPKRTTGLSISSFMVFHTVGHIVLSKITFDGKLKEISDFVDSSGWTKVPGMGHAKGDYLMRKSTSAWYRDTSNRFLSELSRYSPMDDFAQAFAFYHTSRDYLQKIDQKKFELIDSIISGIV